MVESTSQGFTDQKYSENHYLTKENAQIRAKNVSKVHYELATAMIKGGETFHGQVAITFNLERQDDESVFIDYKGKLVKSFVVNGQKVEDASVFDSHKIRIPKDLQKVGENTAVVEFESFYVHDCQGMHHFKDEADNQEYIYTELEPFNCHVWFPCFDQPDLKATYRMMVLAPTDWTVVSTCPNKEISAQGSQPFEDSIKSFNLKSDFASVFGETQHHCFEFEKSQPISTYLYSCVCGPFSILHPSDDSYHLPMRLFCRKSLEKYVQNIKDDWFRVTRAGIDFYEGIFNTKYAFGKFDQVFAPDYNMGAMENVGCVLYRDDYVQRDQVFTKNRQENIYNTILHEISHMWFGNLVTMKWWDDLWLNESFANMVSYVCMEEAKGLEDVKLAWNIFLGQQGWGLRTDQLDSTHPIACNVPDTGAADLLFDGISYGKGASFLHQMVFYFGMDVLRAGLATYFAKYAFKNTELPQFIGELSAAAKNMGIEEDMEKWSDSWLKTAGCNTISYSYVKDNDGKISEFTTHQDIYKADSVPTNCLRKQKIQIALYNDQMKIYKVATVQTDDKNQIVPVQDFVGEQAPFAIMVNHDAQGYGKFIIDEQSLNVFENNLHKIEDNLTRKQIYTMLFDMIKSGHVAGSRVIQIIKNNILHETAEDVISDNFMYIPAILAKYLPEESYDRENADLFEVMIHMLESKKFSNSVSTIQMIFAKLIGFAKSEVHAKHVFDMFMEEKVTNLKGEVIEGVSQTTAQKHQMVKVIFGAKDISMDDKQKSMEKLAIVDSSDMLGRTKMYCESVIPDIENKRKCWQRLFECKEKWSLYQTEEFCCGFRVYSQRDLLKEFTDDFFVKIDDIIKTQGRNTIQSYYFYLQPNMFADDVTIQKFQNKLDAEKAKEEPSDRLVKYLTDSICDLKEKQAARALSRKWEAEKKA